MNYNNLTNEDLLKMVIMEKSGEDTVNNLFKSYLNLSDLIVNSDLDELMTFRGVGTKRAQQIKAIYELAKRLYSKNYIADEYKIKQPSDAADLLMTDMRYLKQEVLKVIMLNTKNIVIDVVTVSMGSLNSSIVHPREVFVPAIKKSASSIIISHNHPSGDPAPSSEDINITHRLKESGKIIGIDLVDHLIIGDGRFVSLKERNII